MEEGPYRPVARPGKPCPWAVEQWNGRTWSVVPGTKCFTEQDAIKRANEMEEWRQSFQATEQARQQAEQKARDEQARIARQWEEAKVYPHIWLGLMEADWRSLREEITHLIDTVVGEVGAKAVRDGMINERQRNRLFDVVPMMIKEADKGVQTKLFDLYRHATDYPGKAHTITPTYRRMARATLRKRGRKPVT